MHSCFFYSTSKAQTQTLLSMRNLRITKTRMGGRPLLYAACRNVGEASEDSAWLVHQVNSD